MQRSAVRQWVSFPMAWLIGALIILLILATVAWITMDRPVPLQLEWNHNTVQLAPVPEVLPPPVVMEEQVIILAPAPVDIVAPQVFPPAYWQNLFEENKQETQAALAALPHIEGAVQQIARPRNLSGISPDPFVLGGGSTSEAYRWLARLLPLLSVPRHPILQEAKGEGNGISVTLASTPLPVLMDGRQIIGVISQLGDSRAQLAERAYYFFTVNGGKAHAASKDLATGGNNTDYLLAGLVVNDKLCLLPEEMAGYSIHLAVADDILVVSTVYYDGWHQIAIPSSILFSQCG